jgi:G patch domain-containing protein 1
VPDEQDVKKDIPSAPTGFEFLKKTSIGPVDDEIPYVDASVAKEALTNPTIPYADPSQRQRYYAFLRYHAADENKKPKLDLSNLQELRDFARVAIVFRPLRGEIASRFAPASTYRSDPDDIIQQGKITSTAKEAALMGQYGPLTQIVTRFIPEKLLAKRFNVPHTVLSEEFEI